MGAIAIFVAFFASSAELGKTTKLAIRMHLEADECGISLGLLGPFFAVQGQPMASSVEIAHVSLPIGGHLLRNAANSAGEPKSSAAMNVPAPEWLAAEHHGHGERRQWVPELFGDVVMANGVIHVKANQWRVQLK